MDKKIEKMLSDIYMIDESLREKEKELIEIIEELLKSRPDAKIDEKFVVSLKRKLVNHAKTGGKAASSRLDLAGAFTFRNKLAYSLFGMIVAVMALAPVFFYQKEARDNSDQATPSSGRKFESAGNISKIADNAFGLFSVSEIQKSGSQGGVGIGGGGAAAPMQSAERSGSEKLSTMPVNDMVNYKYVYKGGDIELSPAKADVYARSKNSSLNNLASLLQSADSKLMDLSKFQNVEISGITFSENIDYGYEVNLLPKEGSAYIYMNWAKWPNPYASCGVYGCPESMNLKMSDVPSDQSIIDKANEFLASYGIDRSSYGEPKVMKNFLDQRPLGSDAQVFVPDNVTAVYPLKINGTEVYDMTGEPDGIFVDVNIRNNKVSSVRNLYMNNFESSGYEAEQDPNAIISFAEKGGLYGDYVFENPSRTEEIDLGTPFLALVKTWKYSETKMAGQDYYVPSYIFPVQNKPEGYYYRKYVIVPAIKDLIQSGGENPPMPLSQPETK